MDTGQGPWAGSWLGDAGPPSADASCGWPTPRVAHTESGPEDGQGQALPGRGWGSHHPAGLGVTGPAPGHP